jgi:hypothetical protein
MMAHPLSTPLDAAEMLTARGWVVFPADHPDAGTHCTGTARACRERTCKAERDPAQRGKHPRVKWGEITTPADSVTLRRWFGRDAIPANVAIACGPSGLVIVDEDHAERGGLAGAAASVGQDCPDTFTVATHAGRRHFYFTAPIDPATGLRWPIGNAPGGLARFGCDVRGGGSASAEAGGYVITAGSTHASGEIYTAGDPYREAIELPPWLIEMVLDPGPPATAEGVSSRTGPGGETAGTLRTSDGARWDDAPRYGSAQDLCAQFERHCDEIEHEGGAFRHELFLAARDGWRCVALGLLDEPTMLRTLDACVHRVWRAEPDDRDHVIVFAEALPAAQASPWELSGAHRGAPADLAGRTFLRSSEAAAVDLPTAPGLTSDDEPADRTTHGNLSVEPARDSAQDEDEAAARYARKLAAKIEDERLRRDARAALAAEDVEPLPCYTPKERKARPTPDYLVPKMIYRNGLTVLFGATGAGKSTLALDVALSLAAGREWRGHRLASATGEPGMVHYVMAEGEDSSNLRTDAWLYHHGATDDDIEDHFRSFPAVVMLTEAGIKPYLFYVKRDKPDLIVLDTKNLMFAGRESAGEDLGEMLRAIRALQAAAGGCAVILIDHPGLGDPTRVRGGNAEENGADIVVRVTDEGGLRLAEVTKDRAAELGHRWYFRLSQVSEVQRRPFVDAPVVCISAEHDPVTSLPDWWLIQLPEDRIEKITHALNDKGQPAEGKAAAQDIVRVMLKVRSELGQTEAEIFAMIKEKPVIKPRRGPKPLPHSRSSVGAGVTLLQNIGAIDTSGAGRGARYVLADWWRSS